MPDRYDTSTNPEGQYQPGSDDKVLLNKLDITHVEEMEEVEVDQQITVADIFEWHRKWLGNVYEWAGKQRSVNMGKGDFHFAVAQQISYCLSELDKNTLDHYTPCYVMDDERLIEAGMGGNYKPMQVFVRQALRDAEQGVL